MNPWRSALFTALDGLARTFERGSRLVSYAAAGLLTVADLRLGMVRGWRRWQEAAGETHGFAGLMQWERDFYLRFLEPGDLTLVIGCGRGRDLAALLDLGYRVEGIDLVPDSIERLRQALAARGRVTPLYTGAIESVDLEKRYDVFLFSWFCYSFIPQRASRVAVLRKLRDQLNPGGRILVSYPPSAAIRRLPIWVSRAVARVSGSDWRPEHGDVVSVTDGVAFYEHRFPAGALEAEADAADLRVVFHERQDRYWRAVLTA